MISSITLRNFRCFDEHTIPLKPVTVVVGRNNAGKSTVVEALRLVALVVSRYGSLGYHAAPAWPGLSRRDVGVSPSLRGLGIAFETLFHRYGDPPAIVEANFEGGHKVCVYVGPDERAHAVIRDPSGDPIRTKAAALLLNLPSVEIQPQIGPLGIDETVLSMEYVRASVASKLSSQHFRNQLEVFAGSYQAFKNLAESSWRDLQLRDFGRRGPPADRQLYLHVRNEDFVAEVGAMGHGLQMWLQTMWFLARVPNARTVILDEPDVYMHPDLQRRLIRLVRRRHPQCIVATHSVEIMAEVEPDEILVIDRRRQRSKFATGLKAAQQLIDHVGSVHNLALAKLWHARRCLLIEGKDMRLLAELYDVLYPDSQDGLGATPNMSIGGWGGWARAVGSSLFLKNAGGEAIYTYCILDSDYFSPETIKKRLDEAAANDVILHIWGRKEIENYLLVPSVIVRLIAQRASRRVQPPSPEAVGRQVDTIAKRLREVTFDAIAAEILSTDRSLGAGGANKRARRILAKSWATPERRIRIVSGKEVLKRLSEWTQSEYGVSLNAAAVAAAFQADEVDDEVAAVLRAIHERSDFAEALALRGAA